jgi:hypothetical protein
VEHFIAAREEFSSHRKEDITENPELGMLSKMGVMV